jgi:hypothetical protein
VRVLGPYTVIEYVLILEACIVVAERRVATVAVEKVLMSVGPYVSSPVVEV